jgi:hypothetical protein
MRGDFIDILSRMAQALTKAGHERSVWGHEAAG